MCCRNKKDCTLLGPFKLNVLQLAVLNYYKGGKCTPFKKHKTATNVSGCILDRFDS